MEGRQRSRRSMSRGNRCGKRKKDESGLDGVSRKEMRTRRNIVGKEGDKTKKEKWKWMWKAETEQIRGHMNADIRMQ